MSFHGDGQQIWIRHRSWQVVQGGNEKCIYFKQRAFIAASAGLDLPLPFFLVKKVSKSSQIS